MTDSSMFHETIALLALRRILLGRTGLLLFAGHVQHRGLSLDGFMVFMLRFFMMRMEDLCRCAMPMRETPQNRSTLAGELQF